LVCKQQGERCHGAGWCCEELECQNVHVGSEITTDMSCQKKCLDEGMVCGGSGPSCCGDLGCSYLQWKGKYECTPGPAAFLARPSAPADHITEVANAAVPDLEESLVHIEANQSQNVLAETLSIAALGCKQPGEVCGGPGRQTLTCCGDVICSYIDSDTDMRCPQPQQCKSEGERCSGLGQCCQELECQNVHVGSEIITEMSCQKQCLDEGMVCGGSGPSCCRDLGCSYLQWKGQYVCTPP